MQDPVVMVPMATATVAVTLVLALRSTVVWPFSVLWTSSVLPVTLAICPEAEGANAVTAGPLVAVVEVVVGLVAAAVVTVVLSAFLAALGVDPPPHAAATSETAIKVPVTRTERRAVPDLVTILLITCPILYLPGGWAQSLRKASMGAKRAARDAG
jgi:hypothetical protein